LPLVFGITGSNAAGKGEVAAFLASRGFRLHSLSDVVREEAAARGLAPLREHLIRIGNELRAEGGAGVLARRLLPRIGSRDVVDSIRNPAEVEVLRRLDGFVLLGVRASTEVRFRRSLDRKRPGDPRTLEEFRAREEQENRANPTGQQLDATFALADRVVENEHDLVALHEAVEALLRGYEGAGPPVR
jgi:dephospho-CoA kinase